MITHRANLERVPHVLIAAGLACFLLSTGGVPAQPAPTDLFLRGYSVIPSPRKVALQTGDVAFGAGWKWTAAVPASHIAVRTLISDLRAFHRIDLQASGGEADHAVSLSVKPGTVRTGSAPEIDAQGYLLKISDRRIEVTGNGDPGLFYGVQTLLQLLKPGPTGALSLPECAIEDWPSLQLRFLHWDTKHHQDRIETLKHYLDWSARFKINMIGFELEDKFEYPSHPVIGAPGAFTTAELQAIVDYGLERFIQVVPQIQSPAHMAFVLKHPEFADLKADGNNYQACLCDERTYKLIFSMYEDVVRATRGVDYFHVSTDEVYYAGICAKCDKPYNPENRSLRWIEFANRAHEFLQARNRRMLAWVEYPVLSKHIPLLPAGLINGVMSGDPEQTRLEDQRGIRQLVYTSMQGEELLFPDNFTSDSAGAPPRGRLQDTFETLAAGVARGKPIGVYGAAWDDSGLHGETFWLGWSTVAQYGWKPGFPSVAQHTAEFMNVYYGPGAGGMADIYRSMQRQARFFDRSWDRVVSKVRGPAYGNSEGKGVGGVRHDRTLPTPPVPALPALDFAPVYEARHATFAAEARKILPENEALEQNLHDGILRASRNRYNLEVFLSIARLAGHQARVVTGLTEIEKSLQDARAAHSRNQYRRALSLLIRSWERAESLVQERRDTYDQLRGVWEKSRYPKGREVNGRKFLHVMDDTKDHFADRRPDLSYMIAPEESIGLEDWVARMKDVVRKYAEAHSLSLRSEPE
jgi:hexosaminidase